MQKFCFKELAQPVAWRSLKHVCCISLIHNNNALQRSKVIADGCWSVSNGDSARSDVAPRTMWLLYWVLSFFTYVCMYVCMLFTCRHATLPSRKKHPFFCTVEWRRCSHKLGYTGLCEGVVEWHLDTQVELTSAPALKHHRLASNIGLRFSPHLQVYTRTLTSNTVVIEQRWWRIKRWTCSKHSMYKNQYFYNHMHK